MSESIKDELANGSIACNCGDKSELCESTGPVFLGVLYSHHETMDGGIPCSGIALTDAENDGDIQPGPYYKFSAARWMLMAWEWSPIELALFEAMGGWLNYGEDDASRALIQILEARPGRVSCS